ncbi:MAG: amino acid ABC transporter substrate-binding protein, partial [Oscillospiraceae bacterium]
AYDGVNIIAKLIESEKITGSMSTDEICEKLTAAITKDGFSYDGITGTGMTWKTSGEVDKGPKAVEIKDGAYSALE